VPIAAALTAAAGAVAVRPGSARLLASRLGVRSPPAASRDGAVSSGLLAAALAAVVTAVAWYRFEALATCAVGGFVLLGLARLRRRSTTRRAAAVRRAAVVATCDLLAAELRAGQPPPRALARAAQSFPELKPAASAARLGGDVPATLREAAILPGGASLATVAAAWQVAHRTGAGLADVLDRTAEGMRVEEATRQEVAASLAAPRATARLLALLPVFGLLLGSGVGVNPWSFLFSTTPGLVCLALGCGLALTGLAWVERLADAAEA